MLQPFQLFEIASNLMMAN